MNILARTKGKSKQNLHPKAGALRANRCLTKKLSPLETAANRAKQNLATGEKLATIAESCGDIPAIVTADLLKLASSDKASGELSNLNDKKGRAFSCPQSFISANTRLDVYYQIKTARRHQRTISDSFAAHFDDIINYGLDVSFLTPTFPNLKAVGFRLNDEYQSTAWELFLDMKIFSEFFYAGYNKTDWTLGNRAERKKEKRAFDLSKDSINYHCHSLAINYKPFATGSTAKLEYQLKRLKAKIKASKTDLKKSESHITQFYKIEKRLIQNSLRIVDAWTLCLKKAHKIVFGTDLKINTKSGRANFDFRNVPLSEITTYDAADSKGGVFWEIARTADYVAKANSYKDLPAELLLEAENVFKGKRLLNGFGAFIGQGKVKRATSAAGSSLDNQLTKRSEKPTQQTDKDLFDNCLRGEFEQLKNYGIRLCEQGLRDTWLNYLKVNAPLIIAKRRSALLDRFPNAVFTDLSGEKFWGWRAKKLIKQSEKESKADYDVSTDSFRQFESYRVGVYDADEFKAKDDYYHFVNDIRRQRERKKYLKRVFRGWQNSDERYVPQAI